MSYRHPLVLVLVIFACYIYVLPRWADWSQNSRLDLVRALSEQRDVVIDDYVSNTGDYALYNGHAYLDKAPGPAFIALPVAQLAQPLLNSAAVRQRLGRLAGGGALSGTLNPSGSGLNDDKVRVFVLQVLLTAATVALPAALSALALGVVLRSLGVSRVLATLLMLGYGLASLLAVYGGNFYSHALVAAFLIGACAVAVKPYRIPRAILIGLLGGWIVISEYPAALPVGLIGLSAVWLWRQPRALLWMIVGGLAPLLLLAVYDMRAFGTPLPVGYEHSALWQNQHQTGFLSITYPHPDALWGLTFGLFRGLFVRAPWLLLALPGYVLWWRGGQLRPIWWVSVLAPLSLLLVYASSIMWWGGFGAGPRYLVPAVPFLALACAPAALALWRSRWGRAALLLLLLASFALTWSEAVAQQGFPPDTIANPWLDYTLPAWISGNIARNLGVVLGLHGAASMLPLALLALLGGALALRLAASERTAGAAPAPMMEGNSVATIQH